MLSFPIIAIGVCFHSFCINFKTKLLSLLDPNVYKITTLLLLFAAMAALAAIQLCNKTNMVNFMRWMTGRQTGEVLRNSHLKPRRTVNSSSTSCTKTEVSTNDSSQNRVENVYVKEPRSILVANLDGNKEDDHEAIPMEMINYSAKYKQRQRNITKVLC